MNIMISSIRAKTLLAIMPLLLAILLILSWISYHYSSQIIESEMNVKMDLQTAVTLERLRADLNGPTALGETIARFTEKGNHTISKEQYSTFLQNAIPSNALIVGSGIWFEPFNYKSDVKYFGPYAYKDKGQIVYTEDYEKPEYNYPDQQWYKSATQITQPVIWNDPYYDETSNITMATACFPFYHADKKLMGMTTVDIDLTDLQKLVSSIKVGEKGWASLLDQNGTYMSDRDSTKNMKVKITEETNSSLANAGKEALKNKRGHTTYTQGNNSYLLYYEQMPVTGWILMLSMPEDELYAPLNALLWKQIIVGTVAILLILIGIILYTRFITKNIDEVKRLSALMADGDLRASMSVTSKDEFGQMGQNFNKMITNLRNLLHKIIVNSQQVAAASQELTANAHETAKATENITMTIQDVAAVVANQVEYVGKTTTSVNEISSKITHINGEMQNVTKMTLQTADKALEGNQIVMHAITQMNLINTKIGTATEVVNILGNKSREIDNIISLITNIAGQTNLLALNAAIEAARAGEQGKGFAVVADEVRKLAEQSEAAAKQISVIIREIQKETNATVKVMGESASSAQEGIVMVNQAEKTFVEIQQAIQRISAQSQGVSTAITAISKDAVIAAESVTNIAHSTTETSGSTQTVAATTEEQNAAMEEIQAAATMLAQMAAELDESIHLFKL
jgi:methyl-accepting chemotaxis protein